VLSTPTYLPVVAAQLGHEIKNRARSQETPGSSRPDTGQKARNVPFGLVKFRVRVKGSHLSSRKGLGSLAGPLKTSALETLLPLTGLKTCHNFGTILACYHLGRKKS
jgi:hypothetical protein